MNDHDAVDVVGHHGEFVQFDGWEPVRNSIPDRTDHLPCVVQAHPLIGHVTEQTETVLRNNGEEVCARPGVIVPSQADRPAVMAVRVVAAGQCCPEIYRSILPVGATLAVALLGLKTRWYGKPVAPDNESWGNAVEITYARSDLFDRRREVMQQWGNYIQDL